MFTGRTAGGVTTTVCAERVEGDHPAEFRADTTARTVCPASAACSTYVFELVPLMLRQLLPALSQSCQAYEYFVGVPPHEPLVAVSVCPCVGVPVTVGGDLSTGRPAVVASGVVTTTSSKSTDPEASYQSWRRCSPSRRA